MFSQCFGMLQVRENGISLPKCSGGTAHVRNCGSKNVLCWQQCFFSLMLLFGHAETTVGQGSSKKVEGNGNF